jgi:hypothetical protein
MPALVALLAMIACYFSFYPGAMTWDSLEQLRQARLNEYGDWHPPAMAFLWHQLMRISDGPELILLFHMSMLYGASFYLYLWSLQNHYRWSAIFLLIPFLPWVVNFEFAIWKDVGLAYSWLFATSIAIFYSNRRNFPAVAIIAICFLFVYGFIVRANSPAGAIFLLPFITSCIFKKNSLKFFLLVASCVVGLFLLLPKTINGLLSAKEMHPTSYVMFDDLVALKLRGVEVSKSLLQPEDVLKIESCVQLIKNRVGAAFCANERFEDIRKNNFSDLKSAWFSAVSENLSKYLSYRLNAFMILIRDPMKEAYYISEFRVVSHPYSFDSEPKSPSIGAEIIASYVKISSQIFNEIFKPYFWLILSLLATIALKRSRNHLNTPFWMLPLSGFTYTMAYFPITPAADFRYVYWLCLIVTMALMLWITMAFKIENKG